MKYPKIDTLWKRDEDNKFRIIEGDYSKIEFANIKKWNITEKIDGTNTRVVYENGSVIFGGRTDNAQIPTRLLQYLQTTFTPSLLNSVFSDAGKVILFGEGYGAKIQKGGGLYRKDNAFILFDVWVDGWWLLRDSMEDIAIKLDIKCVPLLGLMSVDEAVKYVKSKPKSRISEEPKVAEGIVACAVPTMLFRNGNPIVWKLKVKDYADMPDSKSLNP